MSSNVDDLLYGSLPGAVVPVRDPGGANRARRDITEKIAQLVGLENRFCDFVAEGMCMCYDYGVAFMTGAHFNNRVWHHPSIIHALLYCRCHHINFIINSNYAQKVMII